MKLENITFTTEQAIEWNNTNEKVCFICDTFGVYAHQENLIRKIEKALECLLILTNKAGA